jgi:hypothetical protein
MKKIIYSFTAILIIGIFLINCQESVAPTESQDSQITSIEKKAPQECATIQSGTIVYSASHYLTGQPLTTGFDDYGYNYQAHMFKGSYFNSYAGGGGFPAWNGDDEEYLLANPGVASHWAWPYRDVDLIMKWNDAWISNTDCNGDNSLDRSSPYIGSGAWLTNHQSGEYEDVDGKVCKWNYFTKIIAAPEDAVSDAGVWYAADGTEIGPVIWGSFATIQTVENDPCAGTNGLQYASPDHAGLGGW